MEAIIYRRFSTQEQGRGSTLQRQSELCTAYCEGQGWTVVKVVTDSGVSAWTGQNIESGNLATLTRELVANGGAGKVIVVEQLDRITRQPPNKVMAWLTKITEAGAALATVNDRALINADSFAKDPASTVMLVFNAYRSFSESQHKSERLSAAWAKKRESGKPMTARAPAWLELVNGEFRPIEERASTVRKIFTLAALGDGSTRIAQQLNSAGVPTFGNSNGWQISYIKKILKNRAVIGEFQPHTKPRGGIRQPSGDPIPDYFPAIVSERDFALVNSQRPTLRQSASREFANLLSGLCYCQSCGGKVIRINRGEETLATGETVRREYLQCERSRRKLCDAKVSYNLQKFTNAVIDAVLEFGLKATQKPDAGTRNLENIIASLERQEADTNLKAARLLTLVEEGDESAGTRYRDLKAQAKSLKAQRRSTESTLAARRATPSSSDMASRIAHLRAQLEDSEDARREVKLALDRFIEKIICQPETGDFDLEVYPEILLYMDVELAPFWKAGAEHSAKRLSERWG